VKPINEEKLVLPVTAERLALLRVIKKIIAPCIIVGSAIVNRVPLVLRGVFTLLSSGTFLVSGEIFVTHKCQIPLSGAEEGILSLR
jgi:hypothetical protein